MIRQNLHCHTSFDDGRDAPYTMVLAAIRAGLTSVGISLHCPIDGEDSWCCKDSDEALFIEEMRRLREIFADRIEVWCGLEYDVDARRRSVPPYDYIIGACHILNGFPIDFDPESAAQMIAWHGGALKTAQIYYDRMASLADIPEVSIVGHFDLITKFDERDPLFDVTLPAYRDAAFAAMEKLNAAGKIFEINSGAISRGWRTTPYPAEKLLRHLKSIGGRILISSDAHTSEAMTCAFGQSEALAKRCGFTELWQFNGSGFEAANI